MCSTMSRNGEIKGIDHKNIHIYIWRVIYFSKRCILRGMVSVIHKLLNYGTLSDNCVITEQQYKWYREAHKKAKCWNCIRKLISRVTYTFLIVVEKLTWYLNKLTKSYKKRLLYWRYWFDNSIQNIQIILSFPVMKLTHFFYYIM